MPDRVLTNLIRCFVSVRKSIINWFNYVDTSILINGLITIFGLLTLKAELKSKNRVYT